MMPIRKKHHHSEEPLNLYSILAFAPYTDASGSAITSAASMSLSITNEEGTERRTTRIPSASLSSFMDA